ncbi:MAG: endonuclease/exonuclease/phosphatase family protein [Bacteroidota bacterium]
MKLLLTPLLILAVMPVAYGQNLLHTYDIQGAGNTSPFIGQTVIVESAVVVASGPGFAYIQDLQGDNDPSTSDGLLLEDNSLGQLSVGVLVTARGIVREFDRQTSLAGPGFTFSVLGSEPLPVPVELLVDTTPSEVPDLEKYEGMYVEFDVTVGGPSRNSGNANVYTTDSRPMREPGIEAPGIDGLPVYDGNPELMTYNPDGFGQSDNRFLNAGATFSGRGVLFEDGCCYELAPTEPVAYSSSDPTTVVRDIQNDEITIASLNLLNFDNQESDFDVRLDKLTSYISTQMGYPQILAVQEAWGIQELDALAFQLRQTNPIDGDYRVYLGTGTGDISNGYLVSAQLPEPSISELGINEFLSIGGILHDRPPMLLSMELDDTEQTRLQVLNLHMRSLNGIEGSSSDFVRTKRFEQSVSVANMVEDLRNENLVIVGDFNAFEFSDGYVDVLNQITGQPSLGAERLPQSIVNPSIQNLTVDLLNPEERYSFVFQGSAQMLDHCVANELEGLTVRELQFARGNTDGASGFAVNQFSTVRSSDHDGFVLFLGIDALTSTESIVSNKPDVRFPNPFTSGDVINFPPEASGSRAQIFDLLGRPVSPVVRLGSSSVLPQVGNSLENGFNWSADVVGLVQGSYILNLSVGKEVYAWPMIIKK